jgi:glycosyltransferase involved in cell wall biosynthesis
MKKVLMIARAFPPFLSVGHSIRVVKFAKYLPGLDWLPVVLTNEDKDEYETMTKVGSVSLLSEIQPQVKIYRITSGEPSLRFMQKEKEFGQRNRLTALMTKVVSAGRRWALRTLCLPDRYLAWLPFALWQGRKIVKSEEIDIIFATCPPHSSTIVGTFLKLLTGKPLVLDYRDDWIGTPWFYSRSKITRMIESSLERWVVKVADKVVLVTEWSKRSFQERYPEQPIDKFVLIPNGCDLGDFAALKSIPLAAGNAKFTIIHAGSLNDSKAWARSPEALFQAVSNIIKQQPELSQKLTLVFAGDFPEGHRRLAEEMGLSGVIKEAGQLPHDEVLRLLRSGDLLLAINYEGFSTLIPGKIYEYWAVGGPPILLLSCPGAASSFIEQHSLGITVDPADIEGIQQAILSVYQQSMTATPLRVNTVGVEAYDRKALSIKLSQVLSSISGPMSGG